MKPLISVIVPVYNVANYLEKCVKSICNQTYRNLEIILVDDGSPDESGMICDRLATDDERIYVIHQENAGPGAARNTGKEYAHGELLAFVDGDDTIEAVMYETMYGELTENDADIVSCGFVREYPDGDKKVVFEGRVFTGEEAFEQLVKNNQAGGSSPCNKLFKRELFEGIDFPVKVLWEDLLTLYRVYEKAHKVVTMSETFYHYYQRDSSTTHAQAKLTDMHKINAEYMRACDIETRNKDVALYLFDGIANECMHRYIAVRRGFAKEKKLASEMFGIGKYCYCKIRKDYFMNIKRKIIYRLFYEHNSFFMACAGMLKFIK